MVVPPPVNDGNHIAELKYIIIQMLNKAVTSHVHSILEYYRIYKTGIMKNPSFELSKLWEVNIADVVAKAGPTNTLANEMYFDMKNYELFIQSYSRRHTMLYRPPQAVDLVYMRQGKNLYDQLPKMTFWYDLLQDVFKAYYTQLQENLASIHSKLPFTITLDCPIMRPKNAFEHDVSSEKYGQLKFGWGCFFEGNFDQSRLREKKRHLTFEEWKLKNQKVEFIKVPKCIFFKTKKQIVTYPPITDMPDDEISDPASVANGNDVHALLLSIVN